MGSKLGSMRSLRYNSESFLQTLCCGETHGKYEEEEEFLLEETDSPHIIIVTEIPLLGIPTMNDTNLYIQYMTHPPEITIRPRNLQVRANGIAAFYCAARGDPKPNIQWRKNGKRVSSMQSRYQVSGMESAAGPGANGAVLRIEPVRAQRDDATYECVAENGVGDAVTAIATLSVFEADKAPPGFPTISPPPTTMVVEVGHTATLPCQASGNPTPKVRWLWNSLPLDVAMNPRYALLNDKMLGALQIVKSEEEDQGKFECVAENSIGTEFSKPTSLYVKDNPPLGINTLKLEDIKESANYTCEAASVLGVIEATAEVKVQSLPGAPTDVRASEVTATTVRLAWSYNGPEEPQYYVIQYKPKYANQAYSEISGVITLYYSVTNLSPYTEYEMYVIAVNNIGRGPPSEPAVLTTGETGPGSAPRNVQVRPISSSTMVIQWDEPETPNGQVTPPTDELEHREVYLETVRYNCRAFLGTVVTMRIPHDHKDVVEDLYSFYNNIRYLSYKP
ncbi:unnamed protein product [Leptidea sinapis]|uniref:Hemolin n=1 Tax=Leptidea sinapis TaxID=189913 RepID=A0A5E4QDL3_9NEOP|nr:unnamed protein product [Leptidea sinapis]